MGDIYHDILSKKRCVVLTKGWEAPFILTKQRFPCTPSSNSIIIVMVIKIWNMKEEKRLYQCIHHSIYFHHHQCVLIMTCVLCNTNSEAYCETHFWDFGLVGECFNSVFARQSSSCLLPSQDSLELDFPPEKNFCRRSLLIGNTKKEPLERNRNCWQDYGTL